MEVVCAKCRTKFRLDEGRIGAGPARGRCSRCGHVFELAPEPVLERDALAGMIAAGPKTPAAPSAPDREQEQAPLGDRIDAPLEPRPRPGLKAAFPWSSCLKSPAGLAGGVLLGFLLGGLSWWYFENRPGSGAAPVRMEAEAPEKGAPAAVPDKPRDLEIVALKGDWSLINNKGGRLLVLQGEVENTSPRPRESIRLKATLKDRQQRRVQERQFYGGAIFSEADLKNLDPGEIDRGLGAPGGRVRTTQGGSGKSLPFQAVFFGVPENLAGYGFEVQVVKGEAGANPVK